MNWLLLIVILFFAANLVWGHRQGFLRVLLSLVGWILVMAFIVFWMVKAVNKMTHLKKEEEETPAPAEPEAPPAPTTEELLAAILEELKKDK